MHTATALSTKESAADLTDEIITHLQSQMRSHPVDLLLLFLTGPLHADFTAIVTALRHRLKARHMLAIIAESIIGDDRELERVPAISAMALSLPGVKLDTFHFADEEWPGLLGDPSTLKARLDADDLRAFVMLGDPFTTPIVQLLSACTELFPQCPIVGGMASGIQSEGEVRLAMDDEIHSSGLIGISLAGNIQVDCVVSQGCRPLGEPLSVTRAKHNVIYELNGRPALAALEDFIAGLAPEERDLINTNGLQIGRVIDAGKGSYGSGDFLIRSVLEIQRPAGAIAVGDLMQAGNIIQFHVRDAATASEELRLVLEGELQLSDAPLAALFFSCAGRGSRLFPTPHHDIQTAQAILGHIPVAGFFGAGEFGTVGHGSFIHSMTLSMALLRPAGGG